MSSNTSLTILDQIAHDAKQRDDVITMSRCALLSHLLTALVEAAEKTVDDHDVGAIWGHQIEQLRAAIERVKAGQA